MQKEFKSSEGKREYNREYSKQYRLAHKQYCVDYEKEYYKKHKEEIAERKRKWRLERIENGIDTPSAKHRQYCQLWFGKRYRELTPEEKVLYKQKKKNLENHQKR